MFVWRVSLLVAIGVWLWSPAAHACKCAEPAGAVEAAAGAAAVFEGQVTKISAVDAQTQRVELKVPRAWKGVSSEQVAVTTPAESAACGYPFQLGESYLVYASAGGDGLRVVHCSRTRSIAEADADVAALGMGVTPVATQVAGEIGSVPENAAAAQGRKPAAGGCASCAVAGARGVPANWAVGGMLLSIVAVRRRRV